MWAVFAGPLKPDVLENLEAYYDKPFDVFVTYYDTGIYRLPESWTKKYGMGKQMDWGSWLYVCERSRLWELMNPDKLVAQLIPAEEGEETAKMMPPTEARELPDGEWYGILEVECY